MKKVSLSFTATLIFAVLCSGCANSNTESILSSDENNPVSTITTLVSESGYDSTEKNVFVFPEYIYKGIYDDQVQWVQPNTQGPPKLTKKLWEINQKTKKLTHYIKL